MANYIVTLTVSAGKGSSASFTDVNGTGLTSGNPLDLQIGDTVQFRRNGLGTGNFTGLAIFTDNSNIVINTGEANVTRTVASGGTTADTITGLNQGEGASDSFFFERQATASDTTPNAFSFTDVTSAALNTYFYAYVLINGIDAAATASGSSGGTYGFAVSSSTTQPSEISLLKKMLEQIPFTRKLRRVPEIAGAHHEKLDGSGYPDGLKAESIDLQSRILALVDIFESLSADDRPYRSKPMPRETVLKILKDMVLFHLMIKRKLLKFKRNLLIQKVISLLLVFIFFLIK